MGREQSWGVGVTQLSRRVVTVLAGVYSWGGPHKGEFHIQPGRGPF